MKKRIFGWLLVAAMLVLLTGCGCNHQWTEADCLNPKTCSACRETEGEALGHDWKESACEAAKTCARCGETEGEALGHDWQEATCAAPETCARCGKTQGETLTHSFSGWVMGETEMTQTCELCGYSESREIDRELYFQQTMMAHWDMYALVSSDQTISAAYLGEQSPGYHLSCTEDGMLSFYDMSANNYLTVTPQFNSYQEENGMYYGLLVFEDGSALTVAMVEDDTNQLLALYFSQTDYIMLDSHKKVAPVLEGEWVDVVGEKIYQLRMNKDRTFTADIGGQVSGTWCLRPETESYGARSVNLVLFYEQNGTQKAMTLNVTLGYGDTDYTDPMYSSSLTLSANLQDENRTYVSMYKLEDTATIDTLKAAIQEAPKAIAGTWTSMRVHTYNFDTQESVETVNNDYVLTISEDGTYTLQTDEQVAGTWKLEKVRAQYDTVTYDYDLDYALAEYGNAYAYYYSGSGDLNFSFSTESESITIYFAQLSQADKDAITRGMTYPVGSWTSNTVYTYVYDTEETQERAETGYTITFLEDGTYTGKLDTDVSGTWHYRSYMSEYQQHEFMLKNAQSGESMFMLISEDGWMQINVSGAGSSDSIHFNKD